MDDVAEKKLLRVMIQFAPLITLGFLIASLLPVFAGEEDVPRFADGATGEITAPLEDLDAAAKENADWLKSRLSIQKPDIAGKKIDFEALRKRALEHPRVRSLLHANGDTADEPNNSERYQGQRVFLLASFSMPATSLRQMMQEAEVFGVPVVFRGFVDNSVYRTRAEILRVFESEDEAQGFGIDPTLFKRFQVEAVPVVIALPQDLEPCESSGCEAEIEPAYDRVAGNIPLRAALEIIRDGDGVAADEAARLLAETPER